MAVKEENKVEEPVDVVEVLEPSAPFREITLGTGEIRTTFVQKPLSFFGKLEVFSVLGTALDRAMSGPTGIDLAALLDGPDSLGANISNSNIRDADVFLKAILKLVEHAPELISDLYLVALAVPRNQRVYWKTVIELCEEEVGLSDDDGFGILETFVDQNWDVMVDFFKDRIVPLGKKITTKVQESQQSTP